jgi:hypothetical protein
MKICIIGNSHIAAIALGWKQIESEYPGIQITFFGAPGTKLKELIVSQGSLVPATTELRKIFRRMSMNTEIGDNFQYFLICALQFGFFRVLPLYNKYRAEGFAKDNRIPISDDCFGKSLDGCLRKTLAVETVLKLRQITSAPIGLIPEPLPSEGAMFGRIGRSKHRGEEKSVAKFLREASGRVARDLKIKVVSQAASTKSTALHTKRIYSSGAIRLAGGLTKAHPDGELYHMNAEYGSLMLREAFARLALDGKPQNGTAPAS